MTALVDASGVALELAHPPRRIVSLIPSTTETLCRLGLSDALVGVTAYCVEPREVVRTKTRELLPIPSPCPFAGSNDQRIWHPPSAA
jgi:ABC-type Fe3+-hydroxamate transport system substrate-binding protein